MYTQIVIKPCSPPSKVRLSCGKVPATPAGALVRLATHRLRVRTLGKRAELPGLKLAPDLLVDLVLGGIGVRAPQLPGAQAPQLEDLEHPDQIDAGGHRHEQ